MATGLNLKERSEFYAMMKKCRKGKIDLILTKSISRFGRNTLDMLKALRELDVLGIEGVSLPFRLLAAPVALLGLRSRP